MISFTLHPSPIFFPLIFLPAILTLALGIFVLAKGKKDHVGIIFFCFCFCAVFWGFSHAFASLGIYPAVTIIAAYGTVLAALPIPLFFLLLCSCFPEGKTPFNRLQLRLLSLPSIILLFSFFTGRLIEAVVLPNNLLQIKLGYFNILYMLHIIFYFLAGIIIIVFRYYKASAFEKIRYRYFFMGLLLTAVIGYGLSEFSLLFGGYSFVYLGPVGTIF